MASKDDDAAYFYHSFLDLSLAKFSWYKFLLDLAKGQLLSLLILQLHNHRCVPIAQLLARLELL